MREAKERLRKRSLVLVKYLVRDEVGDKQRHILDCGRVKGLQGHEGLWPRRITRRGLEGMSSTGKVVYACERPTAAKTGR